MVSFFQILKVLLVLLSHLFSVGVGVKVLTEMKWYLTYWATHGVMFWQSQEEMV